MNTFEFINKHGKEIAAFSGIAAGIALVNGIAKKKSLCDTVKGVMISTALTAAGVAAIDAADDALPSISEEQIEVINDCLKEDRRPLNPEDFTEVQRFGAGIE